MSDKKKVLFVGKLNKELKEYKEFASKYECIDYELTTIDQLIADFGSSLKDVEAIYGAWLGLFLLGGFKDQIVEKSPSKLKIVSACSVGFDNYDGDAMAKKGIILTNVPSDGACGPVADLVLYNALAGFRNFKINHENFTPDDNHTVKSRQHVDTKFDSVNGKAIVENKEGYSFGETIAGRINHSPRGHNALIVGFGRIGETIGQRLSSIGMNIGYVKRNKLSADKEKSLGYDVTYFKSISDASEFLDLLVIACPGTPETYHLVDEKVISDIKRPFRIINVGRGTVIDENALVSALKSGKILFAGLDVYENEPQAHPELFNRQDVLLTPHVGASTIDNYDHTEVVALRNIDQVLSGGSPISRVN